MSILPCCDDVQMKRGRASGCGAYSRTLAGEGGDTSSPAVQSLTPRVVCGPRRKCPRLHPRPPRTEPLPQGVGRALLPEFVAQAAASLPSHTWRAICQHVSRQPSGPITISVGTACSGSEFYLTALPHLEEELSKRLHRRIRFDHRWSCELDPRSASGLWTTLPQRSCSRTWHSWRHVLATIMCQARWRRSTWSTS